MYNQSFLFVINVCGFVQNVKILITYKHLIPNADIPKPYIIYNQKVCKYTVCCIICKLYNFPVGKARAKNSSQSQTVLIPYT